MDANHLLDAYDRGTLDRRGLLLGLTACLGGGALRSAGAQQEASEPTFGATGLHHIALSVRDVSRSSAFYQRHLGLRPTSESSSSAFLDCGPHFLALFRSQTPGLAHYSYALRDYRQGAAAEKLRAVGLEPKLRGGRTYFDDPDGIEVQISQE